jgi:hypothetical protein
MGKRTLPLIRPCSSLQAVSAFFLASVFALSNSSSTNHDGPVARNSGPNSVPPGITGSPPRDIQPRLEEETVNNLASAPEVERHLTLPPDVDAGPLEPEIAALPVPPGTPSVDEVNQYLWSVYQRTSTKLDSHGDFTWKDAAAAARLGLSIQDYVIGGMDADFRELLFHIGQAMDAAGIDWTILSAYRDDYRQSLAAGFKAHISNSFHGGSVATGGYGHGCAVDLAASDGIAASDMVWKWLDQHGEQFGLHRPLRRMDPAHVQPIRAWHEIAATLRSERVGIDHEYTSSNMVGTDFGGRPSPISADRSSDVGVSEEQFTCVRPQLGGDIKKTVRRILNHLKPLIAALHNTNADKNRLKAKWKTAGGIRNPQHPAAENARRHIKSKAHFHLAGRSDSLS